MEDPNCAERLRDIVLELEACVECTNTHGPWEVDDGTTDLSLTPTPLENPSTEEQEVFKDKETMISTPKIRRRKMTCPTRRYQRSNTFQEKSYQRKESALRSKGRHSTASKILNMEEKPQ